MKKVVSIMISLIIILSVSFGYMFKIDDGKSQITDEIKAGKTVFVGIDEGKSYVVKEGNVTLTPVSGNSEMYQFTMPESNVHISLIDKVETGDQYEITLDRQGATNGTASVTATIGSAMPSIVVPSKTGYTFGGYYTETNGGGNQYYNADGSSARNWDKTEAVTLYAKWIEATYTDDTYTVSFNSMGGSSVASKTVTYGQTYGTLGSPTKTGYTFDGWYDAIELGDKTVNAGTNNYARINALTGIESNVTYTIEMSSAILNSGTATTFETLIYDFTTNTALFSVKRNFGNNVIYSITAPGNLVAGNDVQLLIYAGNWTTAAGNNVTFNDIKITGPTTAMKYTSDSTVTTASNHTLYAKWTANTNTITFETNGSTTWAKSQSTKVTISNITLKSGTAKYLWKQRVATADEIKTSGTSFNNGNTITNSTGSGNDWRLNVYCEDTSGNQYTAVSNVFYLDNTAPTIELADVHYKVYQNMEYTLSEMTEEIINGNRIFTTTGTTPTVNLEQSAMKKGIYAVQVGVANVQEDLEIGIYPKMGNESLPSVWGTIPAGSSSVVIQIPEDDYTKISVRFGQKAGVTIELSTIDILAHDSLVYPSTIRFKLNATDSHSKGIRYQVSSDNKVTWTDTGSIYNAGAGTFYFRAVDAVGNISNVLGGYERLHTQGDVILDNQGATSAGTASVTPVYDAVLPSITIPQRTGYTFGGYYTGTNGSGDQYYNASGTGVKKWSLMYGITLYAKWTESTYKVTLDQQSGSGGTTSVTATVGSAMPAITVPSRTGYTFGGYYTEANGGGTQYYNADGTSAMNWDKTSGTTLYAKWTAITYTVSYNKNSGSGTMSSSSHTYDVAKALTANSFTRSGYKFNGWNTKSNGSGTSYTDKQSVKNLSSTDGATVTLYAQWKENTWPAYTYSGTSDPQKDSTYWYIYLKSSGDLKFTSESPTFDVFLVGGGGGATGRTGGGGGYTTTVTDKSATAGTKYTITVGSGGGEQAAGTASKAFNATANGGGAGKTGSDLDGGDGGSGGGASCSGWAGGGNGGSDGSDGGHSGTNQGGKGQGTTTRAFGSSSATLYAGGGCGWGDSWAGAGGSGGGGGDSTAGSANTGGGGGARRASGGSGIVIIRGKL